MLDRAVRRWRSAWHGPTLSGSVLVCAAVAAFVAGAGWSLLQPLLRPRLPYPNVGRLVALWEYETHAPAHRLPVSAGDFADWRRLRLWSGLAGFADLPVDWAPRGAPRRRLTAAVITPGIWRALGIRPLLGRSFRRAEYQVRVPAAVILSYRFWRRRFAGDPHVLGRMLRLGSLNGPLPCRIVGVLPAGIRFPYPMTTPAPDVWLPTPASFLDPALPRDLHTVWLVGRLRAGVSLTAAQARVQAALARARRIHPEERNIRVRMRPLAATDLTGTRRLGGYAALAIGLLLLAAAADLLILGWAGLMLRRGELATHAALGASPARLRQLAFGDFLLVTLPALALGIGCAGWALPTLARWLAATGAPVSTHPHLRWAVILVAIAAVLILAFLLATAKPPSPAAALHRDAPRDGVAGPPRGTAWLALLPVQSGIAAIAITLAVSFLASLWALLSAPVGARPRRLVVAAVLPARNANLSPAAARALDAHITARLAALPGVRVVGAAAVFPPSDNGIWHFAIDSSGESSGAAPDDARHAEARSIDWVTPGFFSVLPLRIVRGRPCTAEDGPEEPPVAVISRSLARMYWGDGDPIGSRIRMAVSHREMTVVGEAADYELGGVSSLAIYECYAQSPLIGVTYLIRGRVPPARLAAALRTIAAGEVPGVEVRHVATLAQLRSAWLARPRAAAWILTSFAVAALLIAIEGAWSLAFLLARSRQRPAAIRLALGAPPQSLALQLAGPILGLGLAGVAVVAVGAPFLGALLRHLFGAGLAPWQLAVGVAIAAVAVALGAYLPARHVAHLPPARILRGE